MFSYSILRIYRFLSNPRAGDIKVESISSPFLRPISGIYIPITFPTIINSFRIFNLELIYLLDIISIFTSTPFLLTTECVATKRVYTYDSSK